MKTYAERLGWGMERAGVNQSELARRLSAKGKTITQQSIGHLLTAGAQGSSHTTRIARELGLNPDWLASGDGAPLPAPLPDGVTRGPGPAHKTERKPAQVPSPPSPSGYVAVRVLHSPLGAGGGGLEMVEHETEIEWTYFRQRFIEVELRRRVQDLLVGRIRGDSMSPDLESGDEVLIDTSDRTPSPPGIFMVWDGIGNVAKRVEPVYGADPPRIRLISSNATYKPVEMTVGDILDTDRSAEAAIIGRIVWFARKL